MVTNKGFYILSCYCRKLVSKHQQPYNFACWWSKFITLGRFTGCYLLIIMLTSSSNRCCMVWKFSGQWSWHKYWGHYLITRKWVLVRRKVLVHLYSQMFYLEWHIHSPQITMCVFYILWKSVPYLALRSVIPSFYLCWWLCLQIPNWNKM